MTNRLPERQSSSTGLRVSCLGLGCMGMSEFYGETNDMQSKEVLLTSLELGVTFLDTADVYGYGHNERLVGKVLAESGLRDQVTLATKCGILRDEHDSSKRGIDNSPAYIKQACDASLDRLTTSIDLYYLHRIADHGEGVEQSMEAIAELLEAGSIRYVGLSEADAKTIKRADDALRKRTDGKHGISAVQTEYSLMSRTVETNGVMKACHDLGILFVAYSPISRGLLGDEILSADTLAADDFRRSLPRFEGDNLASNLSLRAAVEDIAKAKGVTVAQITLAWLLARSPNVVPIPGTKRLRYLKENIEAATLSLWRDDLERLAEVVPLGSAAGQRYMSAAMAAYGFDE